MQLLLSDSRTGIPQQVSVRSPIHLSRATHICVCGGLTHSSSHYSLLCETARFGLPHEAPRLEEVDAAAAAQIAAKLESRVLLFARSASVGSRSTNVRIPKRLTSPQLLEASAGMNDAFDDIRSAAAPSTEP